jgi:phosphoglycerate dehydrogenase-like enzyme
MTKFRLAILDDYQEVSGDYADWDSLGVDGIGVTVFSKPFASEADAILALSGFDIIVAMRERTPFPRAVLAKLPRLKLLITTGTANAVIDLWAAEEHGVTVCATGGSPAAAPELTWALLMALARNLTAEENSLRAGRWQNTVGTELAGKTLGIVGLGKIGHKVAVYAHAFGMNVLAWSQNMDDATAEASGARRVSKDELFRQSDVVTLHLRLSRRSEGTVGEAELRLLGPSGILVNTARGNLVEQSALVRALEEGWIRGAAVDVYDQEPLPASHPLLATPNTLLTPHLGYVTHESYAQFYRGALEGVKSWLAGAPIRQLTHPSSSGVPLAPRKASSML